MSFPISFSQEVRLHDTHEGEHKIWGWKGAGEWTGKKREKQTVYPTLFVNEREAMMYYDF